MKNSLKTEIVISLVLVILAILLLNPCNFWMPDMLLIFILALTFVAFALLAIFVVREKVQDERELVHRMHSGRVAFLAGSSLLTIGILYQAFEHDVDVWLVVVLVVMVLSKLFTRIYCDKRF